jgi:hypothetical protein
MSNGHFYAWPDESSALLDFALVSDAETGAVNAAPGWTRVPGPVWLTQPVLSEPDPETGEQTVVTPGVQSDPVVLLRSSPLVDLEALRINPEGHGGFA